ncbi:hypothetical protein DXN05_06730 [Deminuibacter soli]|uniref:Galactose oxidase n=1 Tax=Deminuibacter soli TaxID=2291815 RepID=A0A3E1NKP3_9BACT|nr:hypothetical protein DXN05_06730 [Deminuibacter soli]
MRFYSHEVVQEKRTSLNLTPAAPLCLKDEADISFDFNFTPNHEIYFGYIVRIITAANLNIDLIYNQRERNFNFVVGERLSHVFTMDSVTLFEKWNHCNIHLNRKTGEISFSLNQHRISSDRVQMGNNCCKLFFGTNNYEGFQTVDIPPMNIRDIRITENGVLTHNWPLDETSGNQGKDQVQGGMAQVTNAEWIKTRHQNWEQAQTLHIAGNPSIAFDKENERLYIIATDSLYTLSFKSPGVSAVKLSQPHDTLLPGNQSVYNPYTHSLHNFYIDQRQFSTYNFAARRWDAGAARDILTVYWQANKFISSTDTALYILGGYGQMKYKNEVQRYHIATHQWDSIATGGDYFMPRYLAALGTNTAGDTAYVMGGYGSYNGNQVMNPKYYYDLLAFDVRHHSFKRLYHLKEPDKQFCFANSLVIDETEHAYYGLIYPKDQFNSTLQLIKGSLHSPEYQLLGATIPYQFHDVQSFADLFYCSSGKKLVAVTLYTSKEQVTSINIYTLDFPPNAVEATSPAVPVPGKFPLGYLLASLALAAAGFVAWKLLKAKSKPVVASLTPVGIATLPVHDTGITPVIHDAPPPVAVHETAEELAAEAEVTAPAKSRVCLFGQFEVNDKTGADCTRQFTPLLKEMFLLISIYTLRSGKGVSSEKLYATLWKDKSSKDAQNNRSVNMVKLKGILDKLGNCNIAKLGDRWVLQYETADLDIDLALFFELEQHGGSLNHKQVRRLLQLLSRGNFLYDTSYPWLEDIQSEISGKALNLLSEALARFHSDPGFLLEIANSIFLFDPVNEEALRVKCKNLSLLGRHSMAKAVFEKFAREYQHMYGEEFQQSFHEVMG